MKEFNLEDIEGFDINNFKRINLVVGKNGVGKSRFLGNICGIYDGCRFLSGHPDYIEKVERINSDVVPRIIKSNFGLHEGEKYEIFIKEFLNLYYPCNSYIFYEKKCMCMPLPPGSSNKFSNLLYDLSLPGVNYILDYEIESSFHYSSYELVISLINMLTKEFKTNFIATTHSYEFIKSTAITLKNEIDSIALHRLEKTEDDKMRMISYSQENLVTAMELNMEVR